MRIINLLKRLIKGCALGRVGHHIVIQGYDNKYVNNPYVYFVKPAIIRSFLLISLYMSISFHKN